ncbi:tRNA (adenosine(37)-N6)-threonylcarbamoyltransferase complex dimerization subunit type 1 TsaB [Leptolyngbya cf. ectocarpi LEGE 11479]|uniref:tRNA (Adenosine(37)-N6)-threonylcarbamoyltransferase complex dimerization subunit type 1 TsaB n=1 Tax=Leptolyngbya cf. ectocarpi LEGE 11479 TaxID=1828722 RepID=A0A928ZTT1_LEPEC|nr:tRNA (adenosine(37)-N6)-threonylcarbamoyltransferase complex dimerization subunit type 1 TsaB [Leptolyngbya ectocarpi]MBE9067094.1 tRNA (adenosine(37)-N6)-threonylcarbamoyltransferase complex dimerization subunit type 1 TsaB [Leptolyngbya cf. ectocarpi LEGE 11479]
MFGLALHTSTPELGLAISDFDTIHRHQDWTLGRDLSSQLHALLQGFMPPQHWQDLDFIAVCIGPGGFTGTRIGVATARTLAQQLNIPLFGISALAAVAHHTMASDPAATDIAITMPAKRGAVYGAVYSWTGTTLTSTLADVVLPASDWELKQTQWPKPLMQVGLESGVGLAETTTSLLQLGHDQWQTGSPPDWREVTPFYGQHPVTT